MQVSDELLIWNVSIQLPLFATGPERELESGGNSCKEEKMGTDNWELQRRMESHCGKHENMRVYLYVVSTQITYLSRSGAAYA